MVALCMVIAVQFEDTLEKSTVVRVLVVGDPPVKNAVKKCFHPIAVDEFGPHQDGFQMLTKTVVVERAAGNAQNVESVGQLSPLP